MNDPVLNASRKISHLEHIRYPVNGKECPFEVLPPAGNGFTARISDLFDGENHRALVREIRCPDGEVRSYRVDALNGSNTPLQIDFSSTHDKERAILNAIMFAAFGLITKEPHTRT